VQRYAISGLRHTWLTVRSKCCEWRGEPTCGLPHSLPAAIVLVLVVVIYEDTLTSGIHGSRTTDFPGEGDYSNQFEHFRTGTRIVNNPEPGLMRIAVNGSWRNAGDVSVDVSVSSLTDPIPQFTQHSACLVHLADHIQAS
jgi:hypothetical protein